eukprot:TRINITY_DN2030_c0_g1_i1.p1 TRINITY_DN2030_c0_g1~~TRINITY_DN2030_c0_g1_i1.p1  ORF type:complete len:214 (+),score=70.18 TRINITY_DN2030_c0_g1_i1:2-643(+)
MNPSEWPQLGVPQPKHPATLNTTNTSSSTSNSSATMDLSAPVFVPKTKTKANSQALDPSQFFVSRDALPSCTEPKEDCLYDAGEALDQESLRRHPTQFKIMRRTPQSQSQSQSPQSTASPASLASPHPPQSSSSPSSSTPSSSSPPPSDSCLLPTPSCAVSSSSSSSSLGCGCCSARSPQLSLEEKERLYLLAKQKIFGETKKEDEKPEESNK